MVATETDKGQMTLWSSINGRTWTAHPLAQPLQLAGSGSLGNSTVAGNTTAIVAVDSPPEGSLAFSSDCQTWRAVELPGGAGSTISGVAAFGQGFVAVGGSSSKNAGSPSAWASADGLHWTKATVAPLPGDAFIGVYTGANGLVAESFDGRTPGLVTLWNSPDGLSWKTSKADPLGVNEQGEGVGSANGLFLGDGTRLLGYGSRTGSQSAEYWVSLDGAHWTRLRVSGDMSSVSTGLAQPYLLRDGILFNDGSTSWFGAALK